MIDFNKPMVIDTKYGGQLSVELLCTYEDDEGHEYAAVLINAGGRTKVLARLSHLGTAEAILGGTYTVRNAPNVVRLNKFYTIEGGLLLVHNELFPTSQGCHHGAFDIVVTDGKVSAIELVQ